VVAWSAPGLTELPTTRKNHEGKIMKVDIDLKAGFLQNLKREVLAQLTPEERAVIEVSTGEMGNKPDAVKLGWLKMRTKEGWTKQRYTRALDRVMTRLKELVAAESAKKE
jgi:hypothetical protein